MSIEVKDINKKFGNFVALDNVNLVVPSGELVALLGPSGSGKTTLLRCIAGLEKPDSGAILFSGENTIDKKVQERQVGFVFQHYALFRHMSIFENVAYGLRVRPRKLRPSEEEIKEKVNSLLKLVQLDWVAHRYPHELSGGQRQRIALARALAVEPKTLLLDEPFGALDAKVRQELRDWLRRLHDELHITSVFVTHDQEEALEVADKVVVMNQGRIEQVGSPEDVYHHAVNPFVYEFFGHSNQFKGELGKLWGTGSHEQGQTYIRPYDLEIEKRPLVLDPNDESIEARIVGIQHLGPTVRVELNLIPSELNIRAEIDHLIFKNLGVQTLDVVRVKARKLKVFA